MTGDALTAALSEGAGALGLELTPTQAQALLRYVELLGKWNRVYNLTALRTPAEMLRHHVLDSLSVVRPLRRHAQGRAMSLLDVGSGGGLPGVVLAVCCPELRVVCVDAVAKKVAFIQQAAVTLDLSNLQGLHARVETVSEQFDVVTSRAFATLGDFTRWSAGALAPSGVWMAMKGRHPFDEIAALPSQVEVFHVEQLAVPHLEAERCLVWLRPAG